MEIIKYGVIGIFGLWMLWVFFLAYCAIKRNYDNRSNDEIRPLALSVVLVGFLIDVLCNFTVASIFFLEPPFEWTITDRVSRLKKDNEWRGRLARWVCDHLLNPFDKDHCN